MSNPTTVPFRIVFKSGPAQLGNPYADYTALPDDLKRLVKDFTSLTPSGQPSHRFGSYDVFRDGIATRLALRFEDVLYIG